MDKHTLIVTQFPGLLLVLVEVNKSNFNVIMWLDNNREQFIQLNCSARCVVSDKPQTLQQRKKLLFSLSFFFALCQLAFVFILCHEIVLSSLCPSLMFAGKLLLNPHSYSSCMFFTVLDFCFSLVSTEGFQISSSSVLLSNSVRLSFLCSPVKTISFLFPLYKHGKFQVEVGVTLNLLDFVWTEDSTNCN